MHTVNGYWRLCLCLRAALVCAGFPLSFTTCFGLHGHLQVCRILHIFVFICWKDSASLLFWFAAFFFYVVTLCVFLICGVGKVVMWGIIICCVCCFWYCFMCVLLLTCVLSCVVFLCFFFFCVFSRLCEVEVTLQLSVGQYVLVSSTLVALANRYYFLSECCCLKFVVLFLWGAHSDESTDLQFVV
jgi:hypothetical protein